jgi:hexosaminidase
MPWPNNINLNRGFTSYKSFKINITGDLTRGFFGCNSFFAQLDGRTGLFLEQGFVTNTNEFPSAELQINCQRSAVLGLNRRRKLCVGGG